MFELPRNNSEKMEAVEEIQNLKQKLSIQREKCNSFEAQQDILMDILNIPPEERNFLSLRKGLENLNSRMNNSSVSPEMSPYQKIGIPAVVYGTCLLTRQKAAWAAWAGHIVI